MPDQREWLKRFARVRAAARAPRSAPHHGGTAAVRDARATACALPARTSSCASARSGSTSSRHGCAARSSAVIETRKLRLARLATAVAHASPAHRLTRRRANVGARRTAICAAHCCGTSSARSSGSKLASRALTSLSPLATLERGYAIVTDGGGKVLTDSSAVARGASIDVRLARGGLAATVDAIKPLKD